LFEVWGSPLNADFTWYYLVALTVMLVTNVAVQANQLSSMGSAKDENSARVGFCTGIFMKRVCTLFWGITAFLLIVLYSQQIKNPEYIWGYACRDLLGNLNMGLIGLMIAALMAALMSTAAALMITASGLLTQNVVKPLFPNLSEQRYILIGRICSVVVLFGSVILISCFARFVDIVKFVWEFNTVLAASFWLGMKWRRANRHGAWASIGTAFVLFMLLPSVIPMIPGVRTNEYLLKTVRPMHIERVYTAREIDVKVRADEIAKWEAKPQGTRPAPLTAGEQFSKQTVTPQKSIFWTQGIRTDSSGTVRGDGLLSVELVLLDRLGVDLAANPGAMNETIRILFRLFVPFSLLILVSLLTPADRSERLTRFYARLRTPAIPDHEEDARQVELSYQNPDRHRDSLLFPNSRWELFKWKKSDWVGIGWITAGGASIFGVLQLLSLIGK
jgi:SSS family solute:Na+ symporter